MKQTTKRPLRRSRHGDVARAASVTFLVTDKIPLPSQRGQLSVYPFRRMRIGDSFAVPFRERTRLSPAASQFKKRNPEWNFTGRRLTEGGKDVYRVWRIEPEE